MCKVFCHARIGFDVYFGKSLCDNVRYRGYFTKLSAGLEVDDPTTMLDKWVDR